MKDGRELAVISGRGIGVRPCVFFKDSVKVASAQENGVLVSANLGGLVCLLKMGNLIHHLK